jgi:hypothetical protein
VVSVTNTWAKALGHREPSHGSRRWLRPCHRVVCKRGADTYTDPVSARQCPRVASYLTGHYASIGGCAWDPGCLSQRHWAAEYGL